MKELIEEGALGDIYHVYISFRVQRSIPGLGGAFTDKSIAGGGVLIDWGVHFLDIVMYCCGDPVAKTVSSECFSKLCKNIPEYTFVNMWAGPPKLDGVCDVEEAVVGLVRTDGPVISFNGAWAQNIGDSERYIDFMGDKGGMRFYYDERGFVYYSTKNGMLTKTEYKYKQNDMFQNEIDAFIKSIQTGEELPSSIDVNILTSELMDAIYRSAEEHREVVL